MDEPLFVMKNVQAESCGAPPYFENENPNLRRSYFENLFGEQWVFIYDMESGSCTVRSGDAGWDNVYEVREGQVPGLIIHEGEALWVMACYIEACAAHRLAAHGKKKG